MNRGDSNRSTSHDDNGEGNRRNRHRQRGENPIGKWIKNRRARGNNRQQRRRDGSTIGSPVGTEALALKNMQRNAKAFGYPTDGFATPIEHSLLYAMIDCPENYPASAVLEILEDEQFEQYMVVNDDKWTARRRKRNCEDGNDESMCAGGDSANDTLSDNGDAENTNTDESNDDAQGEQRHKQQQNFDEDIISYAQLSALLALSAAKNPPEINDGSSQQQNKSSDNVNNEPGIGGSGEIKSIGERLCRKLLRCVTRYAEEKGLDREAETREFIRPVERHCAIRNEKAAMKQLLPAYVGYTVSLMTGNPIPLLIGAAVLTGADPMLEENQNVSGFRTQGQKSGNIETAGLLDECEED